MGAALIILSVVIDFHPPRYSSPSHVFPRLLFNLPYFDLFILPYFDHQISNLGVCAIFIFNSQDRNDLEFKVYFVYILYSSRNHQIFLSFSFTPQTVKTFLSSDILILLTKVTSMRSALADQFLPFGNLLVGNHPPPLTRRRVILCKLDDGGDGGTDDHNDAVTGVDNDNENIWLLR